MRAEEVRFYSLACSSTLRRGPSTLASSAAHISSKSPLEQQHHRVILSHRRFHTKAAAYNMLHMRARIQTEPPPPHPRIESEPDLAHTTPAKLRVAGRLTC